MEKLKILLVARGQMTPTLGTHKVHLELKQEYEKEGHIVDILDYSIIYPNGLTPAQRIFGKLYTYRFWKYLKKHAYKYDVIDANLECVVYPKESFGFKGVLLARSHGIRPVYEEAEQIERFKQAIASYSTNVKLKTRFGNIYRSLLKEPGYAEFWSSVQYADIVHCLSSREYDYYLEQGVLESKLLLMPNGIKDEIIHQSNQLSISGRQNDLAFVGSWTSRKGIKDFGAILNIVSHHASVNRFHILGGHTAAHIVREEFEQVQHSILDITPQFSANQLVAKLRSCKVGLFPSYVEGFGLAVVEQLACGIPVVAYRVPGPTDILSDMNEGLLIEPGDCEAFGLRVAQLLQLNEKEYDKLAEKCKLKSQQYLLSKVAKQFLTAYVYKQKQLSIN